MRIAGAIGAFVLGAMPITRSALAEQRGSAPATTRENLDAAMHGEAFAFLKYSLYAEQARKEGHPEIAAAFDAAANEERTEHFAELARIYGLVGSTSDNLADAIAGETREAQVIYPAYSEQARSEGMTDAAERFSEIALDEQKHADHFHSLLVALELDLGKRSSKR